MDKTMTLGIQWNPNPYVSYRVGVREHFFWIGSRDIAAIDYITIQRQNFEYGII